MANASTQVTTEHAPSPCFSALLGTLPGFLSYLQSNGSLSEEASKQRRRLCPSLEGIRPSVQHVVRFWGPTPSMSLQQALGPCSRTAHHPGYLQKEWLTSKQNKRIYPGAKYMCSWPQNTDPGFPECHIPMMQQLMNSL